MSFVNHFTSSQYSETNFATHRNEPTAIGTQLKLKQQRIASRHCVSRRVEAMERDTDVGGEGGHVTKVHNFLRVQRAADHAV
jgi:hypothetical protein